MDLESQKTFQHVLTSQLQQSDPRSFLDNIDFKNKLQEYFQLNEVAAAVPAVSESHGLQPLSLTPALPNLQLSSSSYQPQSTTTQSYPPQPTNQLSPSYQPQTTSIKSYQPQLNTQPTAPYQPQANTHPIHNYQPQPNTQPTPPYQSQSSTQPTPYQPQPNTQTSLPYQPQPNTQTTPVYQSQSNTQTALPYQPQSNAQTTHSYQPQPNTQPTSSYQPQQNTETTHTYQTQPNTKTPPAYQPQVNAQPSPSYQPQANTQRSPSYQPQPTTQTTPFYQQQSITQPPPPFQPLPNTQASPPDQTQPNTQPTSTNQPQPNTQPTPPYQPQPTPQYQPQPNTQPTPPYQPQSNTEATPPYPQPSSSNQPQPNTQTILPYQPQCNTQPPPPYQPQPTTQATLPYQTQPTQNYQTQPNTQATLPYKPQLNTQQNPPYQPQLNTQLTPPYQPQPTSSYQLQPANQSNHSYPPLSNTQPTQSYSAPPPNQPVNPYPQQLATNPAHPYAQQTASQPIHSYTPPPTTTQSYPPQATINTAQLYTTQIPNKLTGPCLPKPTNPTPTYPSPPSTQPGSYPPPSTQSSSSYVYGKRSRLLTHHDQRAISPGNSTTQGWSRHTQSPSVSGTIAIRLGCVGPRFPTPNTCLTTTVSHTPRFQVLSASQCSEGSPVGACITSPRGAPYRAFSSAGITHGVPLRGISSQRASCPPANTAFKNSSAPLNTNPAAAYHNIPAPFQHRPPAYQGGQRSASLGPKGGILRRRGRPRLKFSTIRNLSGLTNTVPVVRTLVPDQPVSRGDSDVRLATLPTAQTDEALLSPPTPAFIDTDFNKDLFAEAEQQLAEMQTPHAPLPDLSEIMDLSTSGELPITSPAPSEVAPALQSQAQISSHPVTQSVTHTQSIPKTQLQLQTTTQPHKHPTHSQLQITKAQSQTIPHTKTTSTLVGQNLIVQQCPVQSVNPQQVLPLSLNQTQLSQTHASMSQPHVLRAPFNQQQVIQNSITQLSQAQLSQAQITQAQLSQAQLSQLTQVRLPQGAIRLSQPGSQTVLSQSQLTSARALSPAQALSLIRPQQMTAVSLSMLAQTQPTGTITTGTHPQATIINVNPSLAGATLISQPIQMLSSTGYQQMMSMPLQLTGAAGQAGTVLMPLQPQAGSMLHPVPQVINTAALAKGFQQRPGTVLTMPAQIPGTKGSKSGITRLASTVVTSLPSTPLTLPVTSLGVVSTAQMATPLGGQPPRGTVVRSQQVLNIPRLHLAARPGAHIETLRPSDPRPMFVLQQPLCSPDKAGTLAQIRPQDIQSLHSPDSKVVGFTSQGHVQVTQVGSTVILTQPTTHHDAHMRIPTCVTSPVKIAKMPSIDDVPLNLDIKSPSSSTPIKHSPSSRAPNIQQSTGGSIHKTAATKTAPTPRKDATSPEIQTGMVPPIKTAPVPVEHDDPDFVWEDFLEETGAVAVPPTSFTHVECSLESGIQKGMRVEVTRNLAEDAYWVAAIVMTCGPLLRLRYEGYEDNGSKDFWLDVGSLDMHPVGWGARMSRKPKPPEGLCDKIDKDWPGFIVKCLENATVVPAYLLDSSHGVTPIDQIKPGQRLEVQHELAPGSVWIVRILENVGGRLLLRYEGTDRAQHDFWLFYLHHRLHPIDWAKENDCIYKPPEGILSEHQNYSEWSEILQAALKEASENNLPPDLFKDQEVLEPHVFQQGWRLEALNPHHRCQIGPATIVRVTKQHFIVQMDSMLPDADAHSKRAQFCCHAKSADIFPARWCQSNGIRLTPPTGWKKPDFNWDDYLRENNAVTAPESAFNIVWPEHEFTRNQKLEAVNPAQPGQICAATVSRLIGHLMWLHLDSCPNMMANHMVPVTSQDIFPVGWCASNGYPLKPPRKSCFRKPGKKVAVVQPERIDGPMSADEYRNATYSQIKAGDAGSSWCPKIYFNHKCFSGPFLSKGRIAELPRCVGPGPIPLVLKEVLSMLINVAYKSSRVLRELQLEGTPDVNMVSQTLKAKYKGKSYCAVVEMCRTTGQIEQYCRQVCIKLECCPNLFSSKFVNSNCPENCHQLTKTKYTCYYGKKKKRKIGRPPGGHSNLENGPIKLGRRRRKRRMNLMVQKKVAAGFDPDAGQNGNGGADADDVFEDDKSWRSTGSSMGQNDLDADLLLAKKKRKYEHRTLPPSIIKTRGAKLPRYSFERRTHKKIMLSPPLAGWNRTPVQQHTSAIVMSPKKEPLYADEEIPKLESNPLTWSVMDVVRFIKTTDCAHLARLFRDQAIDGQALLLLTLPAVQDHLDLKLGPAIKLCHHIEQVKIAFYEQFAK